MGKGTEHAERRQAMEGWKEETNTMEKSKEALSTLLSDLELAIWHTRCPLLSRF